MGVDSEPLQLYSIKFRPTEKHANADVCSRYPLSETSDGMVTDEIKSIFSLQIDDDKPLLNSQLIARLSRKDPTISKVIYCVMEGWPERPNSVPGKATDSGDSASRVQHSKRPKSGPDKATASDEPVKDQDKRPVTVPDKATGPGDSSGFQAYHCRRNELSTELGCLLWGHRVVIPNSLRKEVLNLLHNTHMGMTAMKGLARNYVWWPKLDSDIEETVRQCNICQIDQLFYPIGRCYILFTIFYPIGRCLYCYDSIKEFPLSDPKQWRRGFWVLKSYPRKSQQI